MSLSLSGVMSTIDDTLDHLFATHHGVATDAQVRGAGISWRREHQLLAAGLCVGTHVTALLGGLWSSRALRFDRPNQIAVAFACSQKTLPVSLFLFETYYQNDYPMAVIPLLFFHVGARSGLDPIYRR
mgnify:CR=1 FL=1